MPLSDGHFMVLCVCACVCTPKKSICRFVYDVNVDFVYTE